MVKKSDVKIFEFYCPLGRGTTLEDCGDFGCAELDFCIFFLQHKREYVEIILKGGEIPLFLQRWMRHLKEII